MENLCCEISLNGAVIFAALRGSSLDELSHKVVLETGLSEADFYLTQCGKKISNYDGPVTNNVQVNLRLLGGKGGFGSMLRAIGAQIEKTTNREACRDLSGRRLRDINEEKRLKAWLEKQKDREAEAEEKRRRKLEKLLAVPKHEFKDTDYEAARSELTEKVSSAVEEGFKKASNLTSTSTSGAMKRKQAEAGPSKAKKAALWLGDEISSSSDTDSDSEDEEKLSSGKSSSSDTKSETKNGQNSIKDDSSDAKSKSDDEKSKSIDEKTESSTPPTDESTVEKQS